MLKVIDLIVNYDTTQAVKSISFEVKEHEIVTLIGANGAGKTSTLLAISNIVSKDDGQVFFKNQDITDMSAHKIVAMGLCHVPEGRNIFPQLTVEENLITGKSSSGKLPKKELTDRIERQYALFSRLKERRKQLGGTLSGGEQQMLAIARGLMSNPDLIMMDEPTLGLAPIIIDEIFELIIKIQDIGKTVLLIEQNANMSLSVSDRAYVLERGTMILTGNSEEMFDNPKIQKAYLGI